MKYSDLNLLCEERRLEVGLDDDLDLELCPADLANQRDHAEGQ